MERRLAAIVAIDVVGYSRLMNEDEEGTHRAVKDTVKSLINPKMAQYRGRIVKLTGDGALFEFASAIDAVTFAVEMQCAMRERNHDVPEERRIDYRVGINIGDIIVEPEDIYGDGVNIAARLEGLADPGEICVSRNVMSQVKRKLDIDFQDMGPQSLKNISEPVHAYRIVPERTSPATDPSATDAYSMQQEIHFCMTSDGVNIAYASVGNGPPLVKTANWLNHLEFDWESPIWSNLLHELAADHTLVRYDERGNGLSDWDADDLSFDAFVADLECVVDEIGLDRFPLFGVSQGCPVSIAYAVRHPEKVSRLILYGGYAVGARKRQSAEQLEQQAALAELVRVGWGKDNPAFRQVFTSLFIPEGTPEQMRWLNDLQRITVSPENAVRHLEAIGQIDIRHLLSQVSVPTLVLHCRGDARVPFEQGQFLAKSIPGARFVPLEGMNHLMLGHEPGWPKFLVEVRRFLADDDRGS